MLTVYNLLELFTENGPVQFYINGKFYEFEPNWIPDEIMDMTISSIDNPCYYANPHALCINLDEEDFEDLYGFEQKYKDLLISEI